MQKLWLSRGNRLISHHYSAPLRRTSWVIHGPSTRGHSCTSVCTGWLRCLLQCAQRFPARPADPASSVFAELFPAPQPKPSQPNVLTLKAKQMHLNWNPLGFLSELYQQKSVTRFTLEVWQAFFLQEFQSAHPQDACTRSHSHALLLQDVHQSFG